MARDAADRYATAGELADDLTPLPDRPARRRAPLHDAPALVRRFVRRHRAPLAVAAIAVVLLATGGALSVSRIMHERDTAEAAHAEAVKQAALAEDHRKRADTQRAAADSLVGFMLVDLKPKVARLGRLELMGGLSKQVDDYYTKVTEVEALDAAATERRAEALATLGDTLDDAGDLPGARRQLEAAIALAKTPVVRAQAEVTLVIVLQELGDPTAALALIDKSRAALLAAPKGADVDLALGKLDRQHGILLASQGKRAEAEAIYTRAIERELAVSAVRPKDRAVRAELAKSYDRRTDARLGQGNLDGGFADGRAGLAIRTQLLREDPGDISIQVGLVVSWGKLYNLARAADKVDDAKKALAEQASAAEALVRVDPSNSQWERMLFVAEEQAASMQYQLDDYAGAAALVEKPIALAQAQLERDPDSVPALEALADVLSQASSYQTFANKPERALETGKKAVALSEQLHARVPGNADYYRGLAVAHERVGDAYAKVNNIKPAADEYSARVAIEKDLIGMQPDNVRTQMDLHWSEILAGRAIAMVPGRYDEGLAMMRGAIAAMKDLQKAGTLTPQGLDMLPEFDKQLQLAVAKTPFT